MPNNNNKTNVLKSQAPQSLEPAKAALREIVLNTDDLKKISPYLTPLGNLFRELEQPHPIPTDVCVKTEDAIEQFLTSKVAANLQPRSLKNYRQVLQWFANAGHPNLPFSQQEVEDFLVARKWADTTRLLAYRIIRDFSGFISKRFGIADVVDGILKPKVRQKEPDSLSLTQTKQLLDAVETHREKALVYLCLGQALRISEAVSLVIGDIRDDFLKVRAGKERDETMPLLPEVKDALLTIAGTRSWHEPVFLGKGGNHLGRDMGEHNVKSVFQRAGLGGVKQSPHTLRHTFATLATDAGCDEYSLGRLLRHSKSNWNVTHRYIHLGMNALRAKLERYSPLRLVLPLGHQSDKLLEGQGV